MDERVTRAELRSRLFEILKRKSFRRGAVTLASGRQSDFYFDTKPAMLDPEGAALLAALMVEEIGGIEADAVGGLEMGAVPLIGPVIVKGLESGRRLAGFVVRKNVKDHGTRKEIEGESIEGKTVVILEDVTTTGGSALQAARAAGKAGAKVALVLSILDRGEGAAELYAEAGIPFRSLFKAAEFLAD